MTIAYDLKIGASVLTADGEVGRLRCIVVDPESDVVTHLVVERSLVRLLGGVREAAEQIARSVPGVALVINALDVRPLDLDIEPLVPVWLDLPR